MVRGSVRVRVRVRVRGRGRGRVKGRVRVRVGLGVKGQLHLDEVVGDVLETHEAIEGVRERHKAATRL